MASKKRAPRASRADNRARPPSPKTRSATRAVTAAKERAKRQAQKPRRPPTRGSGSGEAPASVTSEVRRVCVLTGGGDAPGLNAVLRAFSKTAAFHGIEVLGSEDGFEGLLDGRALVPLDPARVRGILPRGGSILGCSNRANPFAYQVGERRGRPVFEDVSARVTTRLADEGVDVLVLIGGDGTMTLGRRFLELGVPVVGIPKTIDNDLGATELTFGFDTAVSTATWAIDSLHSTAEAHDRVMILEVMGRYAGWIALEAGVAGGADVILVPEFPYAIDRVVRKIQQRRKAGADFSILVIGEGAHPKGRRPSHARRATKGRSALLGGAGNALQAALEGRLAGDVRTTVLGHLQRGGSPSALDRILGTRFGVRAAELCAEGRAGQMVALRGRSIVAVSLEEALQAPRLLTEDHELVRAAASLGIELGVDLQPG